MTVGSSVLGSKGDVNVLLVDRTPSLRQALQAVLDEQKEIKIQGEAGSGLQAIELTGRLKPDVILMSEDIPDLTSEEAARLIKERYPHTRVILVAAEEAWRRELMRRSSGGYVTQRENVGRVLAAIKDEIACLRAQPPPVAAAKPKRLRSWGKFWQAAGTLTVLSFLAGLIAYPSVVLPVVALLCGGIFFSYGIKYYLSVAFVLLATRNGNGNGLGEHKQSNGYANGRGMNGFGATNGVKVNLPREPFVSIHLPLYNEPNVVDRLLTACTSLDYRNYEIIVADDSTDQTTRILHQRWGSHPQVTISHRENRSGFKGGALQLALDRTNSEAEFIIVLDADFVPPPDIVKQFLAHFYELNGNAPPGWQHTGELRLIDDNVAVVQGYQWHILNANENWITSGVRSEYSGSYVVERSSQEILGSMKMIAGSVFMIRADVLRKIGWNTSITEDWELTLRLYLAGYKVLYSPFIQAPAECVSNFRQLARQRMRWAEGHTFNVKKYFWPMLLSPRVSLREKLEFFYYAPYYLQSVFFLLGTTAWLLSDTILKFTLPYWSEVLGWSLVIVNSLSLPLMNLSGLFLERGVGKSWKGILSFWLLSYLLAPYQAYAALKGLLEPREGGWHRTHKTGVITETIEKLALKRHLKGLSKKKRSFDPGKRLGQAPARIVGLLPSLVQRLSRRSGLGLRLSSGIVVGLLMMWMLSSQLPIASAAANALYLRDTSNNGATPAGEDMNNSQGSSEDTLIFDSTDDEAYWYSEDTWPTGGEDASIAAGAYAFKMYFDSLPAASASVELDDVSWDTMALQDSMTIPHTASGTNRLMLVGVSLNNDGYEHVTGITWNTSETFTQVRADANDDDARTEIWYLKDPTATSSDVVISFDTTLEDEAIAGVLTFTGVDQTTPLGDDNGSNWTSSQYPSTSVTTSVGDMVFAVVGAEYVSISDNDVDTEHWQVNLLDSETTAAGGTKAGAASSTTVGWTLSGANHTAISAVAIQPVSTQPSVSITVSVHHTDSDGGDAALIVSNSTTIDSDTTDPFEFALGSGAEQTFQSTDVQRLRVHVDVTGVAAGGSFTLAYDSAANESYLSTPAITVPEASLLMLLVVIFFPLLVPRAGGRRPPRGKIHAQRSFHKRP